jgi:hypothetical protein
MQEKAGRVIADSCDFRKLGIVYEKASYQSDL